MSIQAVAHAFSQRTLSPLSRWTLMVLSDSADGSGASFVGIAGLAERTGLSTTSVRRHVDDLVTRGFVLEVVPEGQFAAPKHFKLLMP